jgi:3-oxoacyl-[acyl-carrier-protein] synthase II
MEFVRTGRADIVLVGGVDTLPCYESWAAWDTLRVMARDNDRPAAASRPFAVDRTGFVMAEASAMLVLEAVDHATARGASIYGEVAGAGLSTDANHITAPNSAGLVLALNNALADAGLGAADIDYVNAHGTGTPVNDPTEVEALKAVLGPRAYEIPVSSTKSGTGHTIGAAGALEAVATLVAMRDGFIPPTLNLDEPDPRCDLDHVPLTAREGAYDVALSNSFAFGGHNVALVLRRYRG